MKKIECIIMDWAGTAIDYGCFAPVAAFLTAFEETGITITAQEARGPMGLTKIDHIRALFRMERIGKAFQEKFGRTFTEDDVRTCYNYFHDSLFTSLRNYTDPIDHVIGTLDHLRKQGLKIGSTTGYTKEMMDIVLPEAQRKGYVTDNCVTSDGLPAGRPYPYMIYKNMCDLAVPSRLSVVKYGDTIADIKEGINAGVWTVGVVTGSNEMGLTQAETEQLPADKLETMKAQVRHRMYAAGAHYVVDDIRELPAIIDCINQRMNIEQL